MGVTGSRRDERQSGGHRYAGARLHREWERLHAGDCEVWPDARRIAALARQSGAFAQLVTACGGAGVMAERLQEAWREFHAGDFAAAVELGDPLGAPGASVANRSVAIQILHAPRSDSRLLRMLTTAISRGESAVAQLPDYANAHY